MKHYSFNTGKAEQVFNKGAAVIYHLLVWPLFALIAGFVFIIIVDSLLKGTSALGLPAVLIIALLALVCGIVNLIRDCFRHPSVFLFEDFMEIAPQRTMSDSLFLKKHFHVVRYTDIADAQIIERYTTKRIPYHPYTGGTSPIGMLTVGFGLLFIRISNDFVAGSTQHCVCLTLKNKKCVYFGIENAEEFIDDIQEKLNEIYL